jgi:hypothetical protein
MTTMKNIFTNSGGVLSVATKSSITNKIFGTSNVIFSMAIKTFITSKILSISDGLLHNNLDILKIGNITSNVQSVFLIFTQGKKENAKSDFIQWDPNSCRIIQHELYLGKSSHSAYNLFIKKCLTKSFVKDDQVVLIPKNSITEIGKSQLEKIFNIKIVTYKRCDINLSFNGFIENLNSNRIKIKNNKTQIVGVYSSYKDRISNKKPLARIQNIDNINIIETIDKTITNYRKINDKINIINACKKYTTKAFTNVKDILFKEKQWYEFPKDKIYTQNLIVNDLAIKHLVEKFWTDVAIPGFKENPEHLLITQLKMEDDNNEIRSISPIDYLTQNNKDKETLIEVYNGFWALKSEDYDPKVPKRLYIFYSFYPKDQVKYPSIRSLRLLEKPEDTFKPKIVNKLIPKNMDIKTWGDVEYNDKTSQFIIKILNTNFIAYITKHGKNRNVVQIFMPSIGGLRLITTFTDRVQSTHKPNLYEIVRESENDESFYLNGLRVFYKQKSEKVSYMKTAKLPKKMVEPSNKIIALDIETRLKDTKLMEPVCISLCHSDGQSLTKAQTFKIWNYQNNSNKMIEEALKSILNAKYKGYSAYFHNFGGFDANFILKILCNIPEIKVLPIARDGKLIQLKVYYSQHLNRKKEVVYGCSITIYDSLQLIPLSLDRAAKAFQVPVSKGLFPLKLLNDANIDWDYKGGLPEIKFFYHPDPRDKDFEEFVHRHAELSKTYGKNGEIKKWILKDELVKYCEGDVLVLRAVVLAFSKHIFDRYLIDIQKMPTLPSIAFRIFRTHYLTENVWIPIIKGKTYSDIQKSYYGGFVDVYKPMGINIKSYDVNSLYPYAMWKHPMPVGAPNYFEGSPKNPSKIFGFVYANVTCPTHIKTPILPMRFFLSKLCSITIYPTGSWSGWYFTEELKNAQKYGYTYEIVCGYTFQKQNIFRSFVSDLYKLKSSVDRTDPWYTISKLLMNSPYGRFGMNPYPDNTLIMTKEDFDKLVETTDGSLIETKELDDMWWVVHRDKNPVSRILNVSVPISSAIAAWSRIEMTKYVMDNSDTICCIDTDGIKLTNTLDPKHVGPALGLMKLEDVFKEAVFIAPKVYGGITDNNEDITKARGVKKWKICYWDLKKMLHLDHIIITQEKFFRSITQSTIEVKEQIFRLAATSNKRELIYNTIGMFVDTRPYEVLNGLKVDRKPLVVDYLPSKILDIFRSTYLVYNPIRSLILYTGGPTQHKLDLVKFEPIKPVSPPIIIFVAPHLITDIIYKTLPHNLKLLAEPKPLLALPIPDYIIIRVEPSLPEIIYLPGARIIYLPQPAPDTTYFTSNPKSISKYSKSVTVIDYTNNKAVVYNSLGEASKALNVNISVISRRIKTGNKSLYKNRYLITSSVTSTLK